MPVLLWRVANRSWRRWRTRELLWGTNYENFWTHLAFWRPDRSLIGWVLTRTHRKRRDMMAVMSDPRWGHIRFVRLGSPAEVREFERGLVAAGVSGRDGGVRARGAGR